MEIFWVIGFLLGSTMGQPSSVIETGPPTGTALQDTPGLLITHCKLHTQRVFVRLDPWDVYRKHIKLPPQIGEGRQQGSQIHDTVNHAKHTTTHILKQLEKFMVTEQDLVGSKRPKRFLGGLIASVAAVGSLFSIGLSAANAVSLKTIQKHVQELDSEMPEIQQRLLIQQKLLNIQTKTLQGTVVTVNLHSALINNTMHALETLTEVVKNDLMYTQVVRDLMQDLIQEVGESVNSLAEGRIPPYLVPVELVENVLKSAVTGALQSPQTHLAYSLGSAIPIFVDPDNLEIGFMLNLPIIERANVYRLKSVLNVGFWRDKTHVHLKTPSMLAFNDANPQLYLVPNLDLCTKTKEIHWVCPSNPFLRDVTDRLCGLRNESPEQNCQAKMTLKDAGVETMIERAGNKWLVSTPATEALLSYELHDTVTRIHLPNQTMLVSVPQGAVIHIGDIVLHHLNVERYDSEIEILDVFKGYNFSIDVEIEKQLLAAGTQLVKFSLTPSELLSTPLFHYRQDNAWPNTHTMSIPIIVFIFGWVITTIMTYKAYQKIKVLQHKVEHLTYVAPRFIAP
ncbi:uncharacterized protein LOC119777274 [Cyprinodon tularosa]|uniref:uncharacterized protein LOC119777274 n=1 Tax=Cyprinodon tularosa TaxID=77115 RepID=UPI0018E237BF|nr:uncharacterized protein LOC119777274 [Cyprinodon tularosa]